MGKAWDNSGIAYDVTVWQQCLRVLKPGGHLIAFGGSRTYHRLAVAIEDAGFEIRDQIQWIYGSGFPKSLDVSKAMDKQAGATREVVTEVREDMFGEYEKVNRYKAATQTGVMSGLNGSAANEQGHTYATITAPSTDLAKQWDGWGTALKPSHEPAVLARKPLCGTVADNVMAWGVGALNIDGTRIAHNEPIKMMKAQTSKQSMTGSGKFGQAGRHVDVAELKESGRWPANVILDEDAAVALNMQSGGGASRFFYTAKASKSEREAGLYYEEWVKAGAMTGAEYREDRPTNHPQRANHHPTVKPLSLMRYLVRLVTPKGGKVLDPFMGSGSTGCASILEGFDFVGIDITPEYVAIAQKRIDHYAVTSPLMNL
jgi:site-specific DNA-methyltransferase (adenine-specific)